MPATKTHKNHKSKNRAGSEPRYLCIATDISSMWVGCEARCRIHREFNLNTLTIVVFLLVIPADEQSSFKTGKELQAALATNISWFSIGSQLGHQLRDLQTQTGVVILRDRRIDPHRPINVKTDFVPRVQVLAQISSAIPEGAFCVTENFACVGSADAIHRLPILLSHKADQVNSLRKVIDAASFRRLTAKIDASWEQLSEPRQILSDNALIAGALIKNPDAIPHDVWAETRLPRMSFAELATVILNQFDLTFTLAGNRAEMTIIPVNPHEILEHRYLVGSQLKAPMTTAWQNRLPDIEIKWSGSNAMVTTTLGQHAALNAMLQEMQYSVTTRDKAPGSSIRTTNYELKEKRATIRELIRTFQSAKVPVEVLDEDSPEVQAILNESIELAALSARNPGSKFFPLIFGKHFRRVDVQDDRVVLSRE